jgi:hypothetical protein
MNAEGGNTSAGICAGAPGNRCPHLDLSKLQCSDPFNECHAGCSRQTVTTEFKRKGNQRKHGSVIPRSGANARGGKTAAGQLRSC